jgi:FG-GAP-like repeat/Dockerin type I domain/Beta-propeller repeat
VRTHSGEIVHSAPRIHTRTNGAERDIEGSFVAADDGTFAFHLGAHDAAHEFVIDPTVEFASYLGGSAAESSPGLARDGDGNLYVAGTTCSSDFPGADARSYTLAGCEDGFVTRLSPDGQTLAYTVLIGGSADDDIYQIAVDAAGEIGVAGWTASTDFPTVNAAQPALQSGGYYGMDAFVAKLTPAADGFVYSTYWGGAGNDDNGLETAYDLKLDAEGAAYVAGVTQAPDFPVTHTLAQRFCMQGDNLLTSSSDGFIAKFDAAGAVMYSTCVGGSEVDRLRGLALGADESVYLCGYTDSSGYPTTPGAFRTALQGAYDAVITHLDPTGSVVLASTFVGGSDGDYGFKTSLASDGAPVVVGYSYSADFPTTPDAFQPAINDAGYPLDAIIFKLTPELSDLAFATFLGGEGFDFGYGIDVDTDDRVYISGGTNSSSFPLALATQDRPGLPAGVLRRLGPADDETYALASTQVYFYDELWGYSRTVLVAGNAGVNRAYALDPYDGSLFQTFDLGPATDRTRALAVIEDYSGVGISIIAGNDNAPSRIYGIDRVNGGFLAPVELSPDVRATRALAFDDPVLVLGNYLEADQYLADVPLDYEHFDIPGSEATATLALAIGDVDQQGNPDIVEANDGQPNLVYFGRQPPVRGDASAQGRSARRFGERAGQPWIVFDAGVPIGPEADRTRAILLVDVDYDSDKDVIAGNDGAPNRLYRNGGDGTFEPAQDLDPGPASTSGLTVMDVNGDYILDIVASDDGHGVAYLNDGAGNLTRSLLTPSSGPSNGIVLMDFPFEGIEELARAKPAGASIESIEGGSYDAFVAVFDPTGSHLWFSTYVGGGGPDAISKGIATDSSGSVYVAGDGVGDGFPVINAIQPIGGGDYDAFIAKIDLDADDDGLLDAEDNCSSVPNPDQRDSNGDGYGNACDPDLNNDGVVNFVDLGTMRARFFSTDADADLNGDGRVNFLDLATLKQYFFGPPGPSHGISP